MEEILHQLIGCLSHYLQGFIHPRWCRISFMESITRTCDKVNKTSYLHTLIAFKTVCCTPKNQTEKHPCMCIYVYINIQYPHLSNNNTSYPKTNSKKYFFKFVHLNQPSNEKNQKKSSLKNHHFLQPFPTFPTHLRWKDPPEGWLLSTPFIKRSAFSGPIILASQQNLTHTIIWC